MKVLVVVSPLYTVAPRGLSTVPPPSSTVFVPSLLLHLTTKKKKNRAGRRLRKQKSPWTTQIKDEELLLIKHGWNHSHVHGKVRECECLWRACTQGSIIFGDTGLPKIMQQKEKCLENKRLVLFWAKATLSSLESTNGAKKESVDYFAIRSRPHGYAASWGWTSGI